MPIQRPDLKTAKQILADAYKTGKISFQPQIVEPYCDGGGSLALKCIDTNETEYTARFPNTESILNTMLSEIKTLQFFQSEKLSEKSGLEIPETHYVPDDKFPFVWHKAIVGEILLPAKYNTLTVRQKTNIAKKIAKFLSVIHACKKSAQISQHNAIDSFLLGQMRLNDFDSLKNKLPQNVFNKYNTVKINTDYPDTVCHFDMHGRNMAINPRTHELVGIFDFGDTCIQKCFLDFYKLSFISRDLTRRVLDEYNKISDVKIRLEDVDIAYLCDVSNKLKRSPNDGICNVSLQNFVADITQQNQPQIQKQL